MGIGAVCAAMLRLPLTSTLLAALLIGADGISVTPQIVIAVVVAFVITLVLPGTRGRDGAPHGSVRMDRWPPNPGTPTPPPRSAARSMPRG